MRKFLNRRGAGLLLCCALAAAGGGAGCGPGEKAIVDLSVAIDPHLTLDKLAIRASVPGKSNDLHLDALVMGSPVRANLYVSDVATGTLETVEVSGIAAQATVVIARASVSLIRGHSVALTMTLTADCAGIVACDLSQTCAHGTCVPITVPAVDAGVPDAAVGTGGAGGAGVGGSAGKTAAGGGGTAGATAAGGGGEGGGRSGGGQPTGGHVGGAGGTTMPGTGGAVTSTGGASPGSGGTTGGAGAGGRTTAGTGGATAGTGGTTAGTGGTTAGTGGATVTCTATQRLCSGVCVEGNCCASNDCKSGGPGQVGTCDATTHQCVYGCPTMTKSCTVGATTSCIALDKCCVATDCTGTACRTCDSTHACVAAINQDDPAKICAGTCDATGTCKSRLGQFCSSASPCISGTCINNYCCSSQCLGGTDACAGSCKDSATGDCTYPTGHCTYCSNHPDEGNCSNGMCYYPASCN